MTASAWDNRRLILELTCIGLCPSATVCDQRERNAKLACLSSPSSLSYGVLPQSTSCSTTPIENTSLWTSPWNSGFVKSGAM